MPDTMAIYAYILKKDLFLRPRIRAKDTFS